MDNIINNPKVAVVVLNYKGITDTVDCLQSLSAQTYDNFTIVAVENGSHDGSDKKIKELERQYGEKLVALYNEENLGFTGGVNTGIRWALENNYDYVALFNNDAIADKNWLNTLIKSTLENKSGITTGLLLLEGGKEIDSTGDWYSIWGLPFPRNRGDKVSAAPEAGFIFGATGGATLYSATMLRQIGMFDENFFVYYEDADISFRAQLAGWKVYYEPRAKAYHKLSQTSKKMKSGFTVYHTFKNLPLVYIKNVPAGLLFLIGVRFFPSYWLMVIRAIIRDKNLAAIRGVFMSLILTPRSIIVRASIQRTKKVTTKYIKNLLWPDLPPDQTGLRRLTKFLRIT